MSQHASTYACDSEEQIDNLYDMLKNKKVKISTKVVSGHGDSRILTSKTKKQLRKVIMFYKELNKKYIYNIEAE